MISFITYIVYIYMFNIKNYNKKYIGEELKKYLFHMELLVLK